MVLQLPYTNPLDFSKTLVKDYNLETKQQWNCNYLALPQELGKGGLQIFINGGIHFFRGNWSFYNPTGFRAIDKVGSNDLIDFRIAKNGSFQSAYIQGLHTFEWEITHIDGLRIFIPKDCIDRKWQELDKKFEKYRVDKRVGALLEKIFEINPNHTSDAMLLEAKLLEFTHYWIKYLNNNELGYFFEDLSDNEIYYLQMAKEILDNRLTAPPSILELSKLIGLNSCKLKTGFKKLFGITIRQYLIQLRMEKARELIKTTDAPISHICHSVGYTNRGHFSALYQKFFGNTPLQDR